MTKHCKITVIDEVYCILTGLLPSEQEFLWNHFGIFVDGYFFMPAYKLGKFDGKARFYWKTGKTYVRLLDDILPFLDKWNYDIELVDNRKAFDAPTIGGRIIKRDDAGIAIETEGADIMGDIELPNGHKFALRPYQYECVKLAVEAGSGFVIAGTGAGKCLQSDTLITIKVSDKLREAIDRVRIAKNMS